MAALAGHNSVATSYLVISVFKRLDQDDQDYFDLRPLGVPCSTLWYKWYVNTNLCPLCMLLTCGFLVT